MKGSKLEIHVFLYFFNLLVYFIFELIQEITIIIHLRTVFQLQVLHNKVFYFFFFTKLLEKENDYLFIEYLFVFLLLSALLLSIRKSEFIKIKQLGLCTNVRVVAPSAGQQCFFFLPTFSWGSQQPIIT